MTAVPMTDNDEARGSGASAWAAGFAFWIGVVIGALLALWLAGCWSLVQQFFNILSFWS